MTVFRRARCTDRHPFEVGLHGGIAPSDPLTLGGRVVVFGAVGPGIISSFVVIPHSNPG